ncbi:MAG: hypothetical protein KJ915_08980 [Candidatus Omnitrophica bacterium]|nr:hypothetical protein [Candidatus Omnitrophota bacterium]
MSKNKLFLKIVALVLIYSFVMLDIAWAGQREFSSIAETECLNAPLQINNMIILEAFKEYDRTSDSAVLQNDVIVLTPKESKKFNIKKKVAIIIVTAGVVLLAPFFYDSNRIVLKVPEIIAAEKNDLSMQAVDANEASDNTKKKISQKAYEPEKEEWSFAAQSILFKLKWYWHVKDREYYSKEERQRHEEHLRLNMFEGETIIRKTILWVCMYPATVIFSVLFIFLGIVLFPFNKIKERLKQYKQERAEQEKKEKRRIKLNKKRQKFFKTYAWATQIIEVMEKENIPIETMMEQGIPSAERAIQENFDNPIYVKQAQRIVVELGVELSKQKIGACSTIQEGIPLATKFSSQNIDFFEQCCGKLKNVVISLHKIHLNPVETILMAKKYADRLPELKKTPDHLFTLFLIAHASIGINKELNKRGYENHYMFLPSGDLLIDWAIVKLEETLVDYALNDEQIVPHRWQEEVPIYETVERQEYVGEQEVWVDSPEKATITRGCPYGHDWYVLEAVYKTVSERVKVGVEWEQREQELKYFVSFFDSLSSENATDKLKQFQERIKGIQLADNIKFAFKSLLENYNISFPEVQEPLPNLNQQTFNLKNNLHPMEQSI